MQSKTQSMAPYIILGLLAILLRAWLDAPYLAPDVPIHVMYAEPGMTATETVASSISCEGGALTVAMPDGSSVTVPENAFVAWRDVATDASELDPPANIRLRLPDGTVLELSCKASASCFRTAEPETVLLPRHIWRVFTENRSYYVSPNNLSVSRSPD